MIFCLFNKWPWHVPCEHCHNLFNVTFELASHPLFAAILKSDTSLLVCLIFNNVPYVQKPGCETFVMWVYITACNVAVPKTGQMHAIVVPLIEQTNFSKARKRF